HEFSGAAKVLPARPTGDLEDARARTELIEAQANVERRLGVVHHGVLARGEGAGRAVPLWCRGAGWRAVVGWRLALRPLSPRWHRFRLSLGLRRLRGLLG